MCEVTTEEVCQFLTETLPVPVISLGAGNKAHGVHIISSDLFHLYEEHTPRHSKIYTDLIPIIEDIYTRYMTDVRERTYPGPEHTAYMTPKVATSDNGTAIPGMMVAGRLRKNRYITITTSATVSINSN